MIWLVIIGMGLATFAVRLSFIGLEGRWIMPDAVRRALQFVPVAVLAAIIVPDLLYVHGAYALSLGNGRLIAAGAAALVAWKTKNVLLTIAVGMAVLLAVQVFANR